MECPGNTLFPWHGRHEAKDIHSGEFAAPIERGAGGQDGQIRGGVGFDRLQKQEVFAGRDIDLPGQAVPERDIRDFFRRPELHERLEPVMPEHFDDFTLVIDDPFQARISDTGGGLAGGAGRDVDGEQGGQREERNNHARHTFTPVWD